jgi:S-layer protein (TIGR01567 family)
MFMSTMQKEWLGLGSLVLICMLVLCTLLLTPSTAQSPSAELTLVRGDLAASSSIWTAKSFGWFYYDIDKDVGGEQLSVEVRGRAIERGHAAYSSRVWSSNFEFQTWGKYQSVAFFGKRYFAGYPDSSFTDAKSSLENGELRELLIDDKNTHIIGYGNALPLLGGYILAVKEISASDGKVNFVLFRDRMPVDMKVVSIGGTYVFKNGDELPLILVHVSNAMGGDKNGTVEVDGVFQIGDLPSITMKDGDRLGNMELLDLTEQEIVFKTDKDLTLTQDSIVPLADPLMLAAVNDPSLKYYPLGAITDYGYHEIRGPVFDASSAVPVKLGQYPSMAQARWNAENFTGFYFSSEDLSGNETLTLFPPNGRAVPTPANINIINGTAHWNGLQYVSFLQPKQFNYRPWGYYLIISFLGESWFAGYNIGAGSESESLNLLEHQKLGKVLKDLEIRGRIVAGNYSLDEGYELYIRDVTEDKIFIQLLKNGNLVDSSIIGSNSTYIYKKDLGDVKDMPIIIMHVDRIFSDGTVKFASIDGLFQLSDQYILSVEPGSGLGEMEIVPTPLGILSMRNHETLTFSRNSKLQLWPGMTIRVADNDTLRYNPYTVAYIVPKPALGGLDYAKNVTSLSRANFTMTAIAGDIVSVSSDIIDSSGRTVFLKALTRLGMGSENVWDYLWSWNATALLLSDDGSPVLDADQNPVPGLLYLDKNSGPRQVGIRFDGSGRIASIADTNEIYYVSKVDYNLTKPALSYDAMLANSSVRNQYIKIKPGESLLKFYEIVKGSTNLSRANHTITGHIESLEPHVERVAARPGRYELGVRIENTANALTVSGLFFNVTAPKMNGVFIGSNSTRSGGIVTIPIEVPATDSKKIVNISYDPASLKATGVSGSCKASANLDNKAGIISVVFPSRCSKVNLTFIAGQKNATSRIDVANVDGFRPDKVINGSVIVKAETNAKKSSAPALIYALTAISLAAAAGRATRRRP